MGWCISIRHPGDIDTAGLFTLTLDVYPLIPRWEDVPDGTGQSSYPTPTTAPCMVFKGCGVTARARAPQAGALQKGLWGRA